MENLTSVKTDHWLIWGFFKTFNLLLNYDTTPPPNSKLVKLNVVNELECETIFGDEK